MYVPAHFKEDSPEALHAAIRDAALATLVTQGKEGMEATHLPMLLDRPSGPRAR